MPDFSNTKKWQKNKNRFFFSLSIYMKVRTYAHPYAGTYTRTCVRTYIRTHVCMYVVPGIPHVSDSDTKDKKLLSVGG